MVKRSFAAFLEGLDTKERSKVPHGRKEDRQQDSRSHEASTEDSTSLTAGPSEKDEQKHEEAALLPADTWNVSSALLTRIEESIAAMNGGNMGAPSNEAVAVPGELRHGDKSAIWEDGCANVRTTTGATDWDALVKSYKGEGTKCPGLDSLDEAPLSLDVDEGDGAKHGDDEEIDWDKVPISQAICCTGSNIEWTDEMKKEIQEAMLMPLPDEDGDDEE